MCGFLTAFSSEELSVASLRGGLDRMTNRGPDGAGEWVGPRTYFGHRRLAILDLEDRAAQPMVSRCGRYRIAFNGEIYNFRDLRDRLSKEGVQFKTHSDTEVILEGFVRWGKKILPELHGMFAFVIWDEQERRAFAARDPYGIKPLYYGRFKGGIILASQVKAILATGLVSTEPSPHGQAGFWLLGSVPEPHTWYRDISAIPSGSYAWIENSEIKSIENWFDIRAVWRDAPPNKLDSESVSKAVHDCLRESVQRHLVSDVPVGVFLSGGIDSGALAGLMADVGAHDLQGVTIAYSEYAGTNDDESPASAAIAKHYGIEHHIRQVTKQEFLEDLPQIIDSMDQPSIDGINTWYAAKAVKELGLKVVVSGVGGDELFLGYESFNTLPRIVSVWKKINWIPGSWLVAEQVAKARAAISKNGRWTFAPKLLQDMKGAWLLLRSLMSPSDAALEVSDSSQFPAISETLLRAYGMAKPGELAKDPNLALAQVESTMYLRNQLLRDSDWASMHHSVELRTPLVDARLLQNLKPFLTAFPRFPKKLLLATSPSNPLPEMIRKRPKTGFFIPVYQWMQEVTANDQDLKPIAWAKFVASKFN